MKIPSAENQMKFFASDKVRNYTIFMQFLILALLVFTGNLGWCYLIGLIWALSLMAGALQS